jgi:tetratricopeptide (TPR) repeat protein
MRPWRWLVERNRSRGAESLAPTGEHAERAGDTALAIDCFQQAVTEARRRCAYATTIPWLRRALALLGDADPVRRVDLLRILANMCDTTGDLAAQAKLHEEMGALLAQHADDRREAQLLFGEALLADRRGETALTEQLARRACEVAERCGEAPTAALSHGLLAWVDYACQAFHKASAHMGVSLQWAARIADEEERATQRVKLLTLSAMVSQGLGRIDEARGRVLSEAAALSMLPRWRACRGTGRARRGAAAWATGDLDGATRCYEAALAVFRSTHHVREQRNPLCTMSRRPCNAAKRRVRCCRRWPTRCWHAASRPLLRCASCAWAAWTQRAQRRAACWIRCRATWPSAPPAS